MAFAKSNGESILGGRVGLLPLVFLIDLRISDASFSDIARHADNTGSARTGLLQNEKLSEGPIGAPWNMVKQEGG